VKVTAHFGEDARVEGRLVSDALLDYLERSGVATAVLLRGVEGFGHSHRLHAERFPDTAPKLPLVAVAVDERERIEPLVAGAAQLVSGGLVTLERARLGAGATDLPADAQLTVYLARGQRVGGRPAHRFLVELLREHGLATAMVLLGVDGLVAGERRRARFLGRNGGTPLVAVAAGRGETVAELLPEIARRFGDPAGTVERVQICKRDGRLLAPPEQLPAGALQKLTIHAGASARAGGHPLPLALVRRLREEGAAGATMLRSVWGYAGREAPHGDRVALVRQTPSLVVTIARPEEIQRLWPLIDALTGEAGLVTSEHIPGLSFEELGTTPV
jgi:PII-like signaling protein